MRYPRWMLCAGLALVVSGCGGGSGSGPGPGTGQTPGGVSPAPPAVASPTQAVRPSLTAQGIGPYTVGAALDSLRGSGLALNVQETPACPGIATAEGTAAYGRPALVFFQGKLQYLTVTDPQVRTADGVQVGQNAAAVRAAYAGASDLNNIQGGRALYVQVGSNALLFRIDTTNAVTSIDAGTADPLQFRFTDGEGC